MPKTNVVEVKTCPHCGVPKPRTEEHYSLEYRYKGGRAVGTRWASWCRECAREKVRKYWRETYYPAHAEEQKAAVVRRRREKKAPPE